MKKIISVLLALTLLTQLHASQRDLADHLWVGFEGTRIENVSEGTKRLLREGLVSGLILFGRNIETEGAEQPKTLKKLIKDLRKLSARPLVITVDMEGGKVARLNETNGFQAFLSAAELGKKKIATRQDVSPKKLRACCGRWVLIGTSPLLWM